MSLHLNHSSTTQPKLLEAARRVSGEELQPLATLDRKRPGWYWEQLLGKTATPPPNPAP